VSYGVEMSNRESLTIKTATVERWVFGGVLRGGLMWFKDPAIAFIELGKCFVVEKTERLHACKNPSPKMTEAVGRLPALWCS
jgi:hypothetical protein